MRPLYLMKGICNALLGSVEDGPEFTIGAERRVRLILVPSTGCGDGVMPSA